MVRTLAVFGAIAIAAALATATLTDRSSRQPAPPAALRPAIGIAGGQALLEAAAPLPSGAGRTVPDQPLAAQPPAPEPLSANRVERADKRARVSPYLFGIDVSSYQGAIDWQPLARAGARFSFIRATAGRWTADRSYTVNRWGATAAGVVVGSYHFAYPDSGPNDAENEAAWFLTNATIASGDLLPVLDLERSGDLDPASLAIWAHTWLTVVERATGVRPIIYTSPAFWTSAVGDLAWFARNRYPIWIAHWTSADQPWLPAGGWAGQGWSFWQYTDFGSAPGIGGPVDFDRFNGAEIPASLLVP